MEINHGLIEKQRPTDFVSGTLPFVLNNPTGIWTIPGTTNEKQWGVGGDKMNCVTQSQHNDFELFLDWMIANNKLPQTHVDFLRTNGYFDDQGHVNFCDRFNSITNGTTMSGNSLVDVADDARLVGLIPQRMLPENIESSWDEYYDRRQLTPAMFALGLKFKQYFAIAYEWTDFFIDPNNYLKQLTQCPIQLVIPGHAIAGAAGTTTTATIMDTYDPYIKTWPRSEFTNAFKITLTPIAVNEENMKLISDKGTVFLVSTDGKTKVGIGNQDVITQFFPTETITPGDTSGATQNGTLADGVILHK